MRSIVASLCLASLTAFGAAAQVPGDADVIEILMQERGFAVQRSIDQFGDPQIRSQIDGTRFSIYFYECAPGPCGSIQFVTLFDGQPPPDPRRLNSWNRDFRFAKTYADRSGDVVVEMDVSLTDDGIGRNNFYDILDRWRVTLAEFRRYHNR